jgi:small neutral amino acid transporter SnatA (MarC family)
VPDSGHRTLAEQKITMVFSRITAIILAGLSVKYVFDGLTAIGMIIP